MAKSKQDYSRVDNKQRIIDTATDLFIKKGAHDTSLADIAATLGISKGTLYYYYATKAELIFDITDIYMKNLTEGLLNWVKSLEPGTPPESILENVFTTLINARTRGKLHIYLIHEAINHNEELRTRIKQAYKEWKEMLEEGLERTVSPDKSPKLLAEIILTMLTGSIIHTILGVEIKQLSELIPHLLE